jgi:hypothetical protein
LHHTIFRSLVGRWVWFYPAILAFQGIVLAASATDNVRISYLFLSLTMLMSWVMVVLSKLYVIDPLPLSRRRVFAVLFLPMLLALALGYGVGERGNALFAKGGAVRYEKNECCHGVHVPREHWEIAWDGKLPEIGSPWGETWTPEGRPVLAGSRAVLYNPFGTGDDSSAEFVALQLSRAVAAVYTERIPHSEIGERYLVTDGHGGARLKEGGFTLLDDYPGLRPPTGGRAFLTFFSCVAISFLLVAAVIFRIRRVGLSETATAYLFATLFSLILICGVGLMVTDALSLSDHGALARMVGISVRHLEERLPGGILALWGLTVLLLGGSYLLAQAEFRRVDAGPPRCKPSL